MTQLKVARCKLAQFLGKLKDKQVQGRCSSSDSETLPEEIVKKLSDYESEIFHFQRTEMLHACINNHFQLGNDLHHELLRQWPRTGDREPLLPITQAEVATWHDPLLAYLNGGNAAKATVAIESVLLAHTQKLLTQGRFEALKLIRPYLTRNEDLNQWHALWAQLESSGDSHQSY